MKVTLSFEKSKSSDVSIMVDALRASTTITLSFDSFEKIIPCFSPDEAFEIQKSQGGILAGERRGVKIKGFDIGNSPSKITDLKTNLKTLILTTSNGTRILENMTSKVLIGSMINAKAVADKSIKLADTHIDVVMAGVGGEFAIEDYLVSGEILYWIRKNLKTCNMSEYALSSILASRDYTLVKKAIKNSASAKRLIELDYENDIELCCLKNITDNVAIYENNELHLYI